MLLSQIIIEIKNTEDMTDDEIEELVDMKDEIDFEGIVKNRLSKFSGKIKISVEG